MGAVERRNVRGYLRIKLLFYTGCTNCHYSAPIIFTSILRVRYDKTRYKRVLKGYAEVQTPLAWSRGESLLWRRGSSTL